MVFFPNHIIKSNHEKVADNSTLNDSPKNNLTNTLERSIMRHQEKPKANFLLVTNILHRAGGGYARSLNRLHNLSAA